MKQFLKNTFTRVSKTSSFAVAIVALSTFHAGAAGLDQVTDTAEEIKTWAYGFVGVVAFLYMIYKVGLAFLEKESWSDVLTGLGKVAVAGGILVAVEFFWALFV